jgi:antitoxin component HigA of HigAB toxin-antitoxin module
LIAVLKEAIQQCGLSLNELAKRSGVSRPQLSRFLSGRRGLNLDAAARLFTHFGFVAVRATPAARPTAAPAPQRARTPKR